MGKLSLFYAVIAKSVSDEAISRRLSIKRSDCFLPGLVRGFALSLAMTGLQHILGNCSPESISIMRLLPIDVSSSTFPLCPSSATPIRAASFPSG